MLIVVTATASLTIILEVVAPFATYFQSYQLSSLICYICQWVNRKATVLCSLLIHSCKKYKYMEHKELIVLSRGLLWSVSQTYVLFFHHVSEHVHYNESLQNVNFCNNEIKRRQRLIWWRRSRGHNWGDRMLVSMNQK